MEFARGLRIIESELYYFYLKKKKNIFRFVTKTNLQTLLRHTQIPIPDPDADTLNNEQKKIRKRRRDPNQHKHQERAAPRWLLDFAPSGCNTHTHTHTYDHRNAQSIMNDVETKRTQDHKEIQDEKNRVKVLGRNKTKKKTKRNRMHRWGSEDNREKP